MDMDNPPPLPTLSWIVVVCGCLDNVGGGGGGIEKSGILIKQKRNGFFHKQKHNWGGAQPMAWMKIVYIGFIGKMEEDEDWQKKNFYQTIFCLFGLKKNPIVCAHMIVF